MHSKILFAMWKQNLSITAFLWINIQTLYKFQIFFFFMLTFNLESVKTKNVHI